MLLSTQEKPKIRGFVRPGFEAVREAFAENFSRRNELGAACSVYHRGEKVVDLWGGVRNAVTGEPWEEDTMVVVYSTTKGLAAMTLAIAHSRGWLDYDERVSKYWPEFAQQGKETITVRQLIAHQAGLFAFNEHVDVNTVADLDRLAVILARQKPKWEPGTRQAYHAISLGFYENELLRRIDPQHRSLGQFFQDEIATPLGLEFYILLPEEIPNSRLATVESPGFLKRLFGFPIWLALAASYPRSNIYRALVTNPGSAIVHDDKHIYARNLEVPSGGGVGTARAIAKAYGVFANGGHELGIRPETLQALIAPAVPPQHGFYDECMKGEAKFSMGFMKPCAAWPFDHAGAFGHPGAGGSLGFADPESDIGYAYVTNRMGVSLTGDPRDLALRNALYAATPAAAESKLRQLPHYIAGSVVSSASTRVDPPGS
jgi:CubicO group peptidase (beta-lactamase class C family)